MKTLLCWTVSFLGLLTDMFIRISRFGDEGADLMLELNNKVLERLAEVSSNENK